MIFSKININLQRLLASIFFLILILFPLLEMDFYNEMVSRIVILAIFAVSLDILVGFTGLVSFGHAAWFGIGAYSFALMASHYQVNDSLWLTLPVALCPPRGPFLPWDGPAAKSPHAAQAHTCLLPKGAVFAGGGPAAKSTSRAQGTT